MTNQTIHVVARFVAKPNKVEELKAILLGLIEPTRLEAGVIKYELLQNQSQPTDFTFVQEWEGAAALDTHLASVREQVPMALLEGLIAAPPDVRHYSILAAMAPPASGIA
ncbi:putative quinol monooxygenase [Nostoc sp.]|uniref:putative quinol monooxygenase n=1 Tax=Nostoc sp. TaxID=1180 RepID=UPI002FF5C6B5